jgi:hypothetical protein
MCTVAINVVEPGAFNAESQYFIPLFNRISYPYLIEFHDFADNIQEGMKHQMGGAAQAQQDITFQITLIFTFYFFP